MTKINLIQGVEVETRKVSELEEVEGVISNTDLVPISDEDGKLKKITYEDFSAPFLNGIRVAEPDTDPADFPDTEIFTPAKPGDFVNFPNEGGTYWVVDLEDLEQYYILFKRYANPLGIGYVWAMQKQFIGDRATELDPDDSTSIQTGVSVSKWVEDLMSNVKIDLEPDLEALTSPETSGQRTVIFNKTFDGDVRKVRLFATTGGSAVLGVFEKDGAGNVSRISSESVTLVDGVNEFDFNVPQGKYFGYYRTTTAGGGASVGRIVGAHTAYTIYSFSTQVSDTPVVLPAETTTIRFGAQVEFLEEFESFEKSVQEVVAKYGSDLDIMNINIVAFGDSITSSATHAGNYADKIAVACDANEYTNVAIGGATWSWRAGTTETDDPLPSTDSNVISNQVLKFLAMTSVEYPHLAIFNAGINDVFRDSVIGDASTIFAEADINLLDKTQFIAAIRYSIEKFRAVYPNTFIILATPLHSTVAGRQYTDSLPYVEAIRECAQRLNIPLVDAFSSSQLSENRASEIFSDGLHPNALGKELQFRFFWRWLKSNFYKMPEL